MLAVDDTPEAVEWYMRALDARVLWSLGSVAGLEIGGAPFFLHEPVKDRFASPRELGTTTVRVELFVDDPDAVIIRALSAGAVAGSNIRDHEAPWGIHRQGSFTDPFGHVWHVGDKSPLVPHSS
jgi:PhnB protein